MTALAQRRTRRTVAWIIMPLSQDCMKHNIFANAERNVTKQGKIVKLWKINLYPLRPKWIRRGLNQYEEICEIAKLHQLITIMVTS